MPAQTTMPTQTPTAAAAATRPRTLTEALRGFSLDQLVALMERRPDLSYPLATDIGDVAARGATTTSTARAVDGLNAWLRLIAEALASLPDPCTLGELTELVQASTASETSDRDVAQTLLGEALEELRIRALLWGPDAELHLVRSMRDYFGPYPGGLAAPSLRPLNTVQIDTALQDCDETVRPLLDRLVWSPTGAVKNADRLISVAEAKTPVEQLLARGLLRPLDSATVILPREVSLHLRAGRFSATAVSPVEPELTGRDRGALVDRAAAGEAFGLLHDVELVAHLLETTPHKLLRDGGLATRDITALGRTLGTDPAHATFVIEVAAAAGLLAPGGAGVLLPTTELDRWVGRPAWTRWSVLSQAWLRSSRLFLRSAQAGAHCLGPEAESPGVASTRRLVLDLAHGAGLQTEVDLDQLEAALVWRRPRLAQLGEETGILVGWTLREAGWLGLLALGAVSTYAETLLVDPDAMPARLIDLFPAPVDRVIVQADLTAVAPGPLPHAMTSDLRLLADQESRGGGGVFRFSAGSLRRGYEAGWSSADIRSWLERHSTTGVPQPLAYLIDDVARQYGSIRVGTASAYLRTEDAAQTAALLARPGAGALGLREIAPGVLIASADPYELVEFLRAAGHAPAVEDESGQPLSAPPSSRAATPRIETARVPVSPEEAASALWAASRSGRARAVREAVAVEDTLALLERATALAEPIRISYVASDGSPTERDVSPLDLASGVVRAVDRANAQVLSIPLARISSVSATDTPA